MDLDFVSVHKHAKRELGQYPAILTSHLVNNPYVCFFWKELTTGIDLREACTMVVDLDPGSDLLL